MDIIKKRFILFKISKNNYAKYSKNLELVKGKLLLLMEQERIQYTMKSPAKTCLAIFKLSFSRSFMTVLHFKIETYPSESCASWVVFRIAPAFRCASRAAKWLPARKRDLTKHSHRSTSLGHALTKRRAVS